MTEETQLAFDAEEVLKWYDNDHAAIQELVGLVRTDLPRYVHSLEAAADAGDLHQVGRVAHTIKGAVGNVCALRLCGITEALELSARGGDAARVAQLRPEFTATAQELVDRLGAWVDTLQQAAADRLPSRP